MQVACSIYTPWHTKTVFALTFADAIPIPKSIRRDPNYNPARYFNQCTQEWQDHIRKVFREHICGDAISTVKMFPTTGDSGDELPNGAEWFDSAWSSMMNTASQDPTYTMQLPDRGAGLLCLLFTILTWIYTGMVYCYTSGRVLINSGSKVCKMLWNAVRHASMHMFVWKRCNICFTCLKKLQYFLKAWFP